MPDRAAFLFQLEKVAGSGVNAIILREKDLDPGEYKALAQEAVNICAVLGVRLIVHSFADAAAACGSPFLHLPWNVFAEQFLCSKMPLWAAEKKAAFGVSVHSPADAALAAEHGAAWVIAGHVFSTQSKRGLEARGPEFLRAVCREVSLPVYAIGGITEDNAAGVAQTGVNGLCLMSSLMTSENPRALVQKIRTACSGQEN